MQAALQEPLQLIAVIQCPWHWQQQVPSDRHVSLLALSATPKSNAVNEAMM